MDIVKLISNKVQEIADNGKLEEIVTKHTTNCIDSIVKDAFEWDGEGKKEIEKAIKSKLELPLDEIKVSRYNLAISKVIEDRLNETAIEVAKDNIIDVINKITGTLDKKEYKLSEIISEYVKYIDKSYNGGMENECGELSFHVQEGTGFTRIYFDKESDKEYWKCENMIGLHDSKIFTVKSEGEEFSPFTIKPLVEFEAYLFQLYANNVIVIIDEDKVITEYYREDFH